MGHWSMKGLRGSTLEEMINMTIDVYREKGLALVQKIPTPITPVRIDDKTKQITLAYFQQQSTVDYIGVVQQIPICFDAKECAKDTFPLMNIHKHQVEFMKDYEKQGGLSFLIVYYTHLNRMFYVPFKDIIRFYERGENGGRKSIRFDEIDQSYEIFNEQGVLVHFLKTIQQDLDEREE